MFIIGSFPSSKRQIEPELLRIIMQNDRLANLIISQQDNTKLTKALHLVKARPTTGSLAAYESAELYQFMQNYQQELAATGSDPFPGEMLTPKKEYSLPDSIYELLAKYYNDTYDLQFVTIAEYSNDQSSDSIIVRPEVDQFARVRIGTEIFGSTFKTRYRRNSNILAKFIQSDNSIDTYPGQVQFYFEHTIDLPDGATTHRLAFAENQQKRFHCRIDQDDDSCNIELWKPDFYELSRDSIMPIHNIYSRFISCNFIVGTRHQKTYMAVIPINRQFHL